MKKNILTTSIFILLSSTVLFAGADAGVEQEVHSGDLVQLSGIESTLERDGRFVRFNWRQTEGEPYVSLANTSSLQTTFTAPTVTESTVLTFRLTTKERYRKKRIFRSRDFVNIIILPEEVIVTEPLEPAEPNAPVETNLDSVTHEGVTYIPIISPITGRVWLDRNLGASISCTIGTVNECIGDRYQWGRESDGHQFLDTRINLVGRTDTLFGNSNIFFDNFDGDWTTVDISGDIRNTFWSQTNGNSICPIGYRVPKIEELTSEVLDGEIDSSLGFLNIRLSVPNTTYWSASNRIFDGIPFRVDGRINADDFDRVNDFSVRCIKD